MTRHRRAIVWESDTGIAPDGSRYFLNSEQIRPEPRIYWSETLNSEGFSVAIDVGRTFATGWPTSDRAKQDAETHYRMTAAKRVEAEAIETMTREF